MPEIPDGVTTAIVGAVFAFAGYFGRAVIDTWRARRRSRRNTAARIRELSALLDESRSLFEDQNFKARRLMKLLRTRLGTELEDGQGFDETFFLAFDQLTEDEREIHSLIRSTTLNSMRRVNEELRAWLDRNVDLRRKTETGDARGRLAAELAKLRLHLNQWHDKYAVYMADERRCLVYLADEKKQGTGFPKGLARAVADFQREHG